MARIRSIKPEFWTSPQVVECSFTARLLFIGLWNFCDDSGVQPYDLGRVKMQVFPADPISKDEIDGMLGQLQDAGLLTIYRVENLHFIRVTGWHHQKIDKPSYKWPLEDGDVPQWGKK